MRAVLLAALVVSGAAWSARCGDLSDEDVKRMPLRGAGAFQVVVEGLSHDAVGNGLSEDSIKAAIELRLRKNAIRLGSEKPCPYLYANINAVASRDRAAFSVLLEFKQLVTVNDTGVRCVAGTWSLHSTGFCPPSDLREETLDELTELVDRFSNDFLAANEQVETGAAR